MSTAKELAILFHDTYERLAPDFGYETRPDTKQFDPTTPNGRLMIAVCEVVLSETDKLWADTHRRLTDAVLTIRELRHRLAQAAALKESETK